VNPVIAAIEEHGLLLLQDKALPNAVTVVTGEHVHGSWWAHPRSHEIFRILDEATDDPDILSAKLVSRKVTFVHRRLWPALFAVGNAREPWQTSGLSRQSAELLRRVSDEGEVHASGVAAKQLEERLLVRSEQVHTEAGRHETVLRRWPQSRMSIDRARLRLEEAVFAIGGSARLLPWNRSA
jgi:hypothetical protein